MKINQCRICKNVKLKKVGTLGKIAISNFTQKPQRGTLSPLSLVYCENCTLLQLAHNPSRHKMYEEHYWYESRLNPTIVNDLKSVAHDALSEVNVKKGDTWIDIGANDGTLLSFVPKKFVRIGVDPAKNLKKSLSKHTDKIVQNYFDKTKNLPKAKIITAIAMLYDLPNPHTFVRKLKETLSDDGIIILQLMTLSPMIENNDVGNICHEHIEYYSYQSLVLLFEKHGLEIYKVKTNSMNGGSYRLFVRHYKHGSVKFKEKTYTLKDFKNFFMQIEQNKKKFIEFMRICNKNGQKIVAYGASTKGNTIIQYYGLDSKSIPAVVDVNPEKIGRFLVKSGIPIVDKVPDCDYLWILPYAFIDYFKIKEKAFQKNGGKFVVCTPRVKVL
ncbi:MAG: methyltransferase domain-containing protein [Candidatus Levybacteria bacterium]|nr:methyltransferase domain-containing protein [Candidatus Levybacteria bacterium]